MDAFRLNVGADTKVSDTWLVGGYFHFVTADQKVKTRFGSQSHGDLRSQSFSLYATKIFDSGAYLDFVATGDLYHQSMRGRMLDGTAFRGSFTTWGLGLSAEAGHQIFFSDAKTWFAEPSVQLAWHRIDGPEYTLSNGMRVAESSAHSLTGRLGTLLGRRFVNEDGTPSGDAYIRIGVIHEFSGDHGTYINGERFDVNGLGTRGYAGVGGEVWLNRDAKFYGYLETQHGSDYSVEIEGRLGMKLIF